MVAETVIVFKNLWQKYVPPPLELLFCQGGAGKGILLILGPPAGKGTGILILFFGRSGAGKGILLILGPRTGKGTGILLLFQTAGNGNGKFLGNLQYSSCEFDCLPHLPVCV